MSEDIAVMSRDLTDDTNTSAMSYDMHVADDFSLLTDGNKDESLDQETPFPQMKILLNGLLISCIAFAL